MVKLNQYGEDSKKTMSDYPLRLLPSRHYIMITDRARLKSIDPYLQRKCFKPKEECCVEGDHNKVTAAAFGSSGLNNMSVNLLGGLFRIGDEKWHQNVSDADNWTGGDVYIQQYEGRYEYQDIQASVYFKYSIADSLTWDFPRCFNSEEERDVYEAAIVDGMTEGAQFSKKTSYKLKAHSECHHSPNNLNYWHMEIRSIIDAKPPEEVDSNKKNYQKKALRAMVESLRAYSTLNPPKDIVPLPKELYQH